MQKYKILKQIGDGSYGVVFKALAPTGEVVAIKKMKSKYRNWEECNVLKQIKCLRKLEHPHIVKLREVILSNSELFMVFDYLECNLYQVYTRAKESNRTLTQSQIKSIFFKIASGLSQLHKNGFFHRDLKPENILCHNNEIKLCDFGLARQIRSRPPFTDYVSTRWYRAPQLLLRGSYNSPVDVFALACIIIELYLAAPLFPGQNQIQTMNKIVEVLGTPKKSDWPQGYKLASTINYNFPDKKKKELSDLIPDASLEAVDLLESMLSYSSRKRPSASEILKHQFFDSLHQSTEEKASGIKNETKFYFYQKNIIEIPSNLPIQSNVEMDMRKSLIKFGNSFGSSFHLNKQQKRERKRDTISELEYVLESPKEQKTYGRKKSQIEPHHDQIAKKFDEMEEILMQLQQKKEKERERQQKREQKRFEEEFRESPSKLEKETEEFKMPVFTFGGIGVSSFSSLSAAKGGKIPAFNKSPNGKMS